MSNSWPYTKANLIDLSDLVSFLENIWMGVLLACKTLVTVLVPQIDNRQLIWIIVNPPTLNIYPYNLSLTFGSEWSPLKFLPIFCSLLYLRNLKHCIGAWGYAIDKKKNSLERSQVHHYHFTEDSTLSVTCQSVPAPSIFHYSIFI